MQTIVEFLPFLTPENAKPYAILVFTVLFALTLLFLMARIAASHAKVLKFMRAHHMVVAYGVVLPSAVLALAIITADALVSPFVDARASFSDQGLRCESELVRINQDGGVAGVREAFGPAVWQWEGYVRVPSHLTLTVAQWEKVDRLGKRYPVKCNLHAYIDDYDAYAIFHGTFQGRWNGLDEEDVSSFLRSVQTAAERSGQFCSDSKNRTNTEAFALNTRRILDEDPEISRNDGIAYSLRVVR